MVGCGATANLESNGENLINGNFELKTLESANETVIFDRPVSVEIDQQYGRLAIKACNSYYGSFTFGPPQQNGSATAHFTIPGASHQPCDASTTMAEEALLKAFQHVSLLSIQDDELIFTSPNPQSYRITLIKF